MNRQVRSIPVSAYLSYLALWPACYSLGAYLLGIVSLRLPAPSWPTTAYLLLVAHACYLLDRVKLSDTRQDPADALALPDRALLFARHARPVRAFLVAEFLLACVVGWWISPALSLLPLGALIGVHLYAGRGASPGKPRFKDLPALKSFFISTAHIALIVSVLWGNDHRLIEHPRTSVVLCIVGLWLIVTGDAILCDLDDHDSDALYGTRSLPVLIGNARGLAAAQILVVLGGLLLIAENQQSMLILCAAALWVSIVPTIFIKNRRDLVDARLLPIVLVALLLR